MQILFLNHNIKGRGTYIRCFQFARHLVRRGHKVTILTSTPRYSLVPKKEVLEGVEVISMPDVLGKRYRNGGLGPIETVIRSCFLIKRRFDLVQNFDHRPSVLFPALISKYFRRTPLVSEWTDLHGTGGSLSSRPRHVQWTIGLYENFTEQRSKLIPEKLIVISKHLRAKALDLGVPEDKIVVINGGADVEKIKPKDKKLVREEFGLPLTAKLLGYTGYSHYDMDIVLNAVSKIQRERQDVWFVTTGEVLSPDVKDKMFDRNRIIELGYLEARRYEAFLPAIDVFLFPFANREINLGRWPNKIGDYMAAGRPIVSNPTGDIVELFERHNIGLLAKAEPLDFAEKILRILNDDALADFLGRNSRKTAESYYDWSLLSGRLEECFYDVLAASKRLVEPSVKPQSNS